MRISDWSSDVCSSDLAELQLLVVLVLVLESFFAVVESRHRLLGLLVRPRKICSVASHSSAASRSSAAPRSGACQRVYSALGGRVKPLRSANPALPPYAPRYIMFTLDRNSVV